MVPYYLKGNPIKRPWYCKLFHRKWVEYKQDVKKDPSKGQERGSIVYCHRCSLLYLDNMWEPT